MFEADFQTDRPAIRQLFFLPAVIVFTQGVLKAQMLDADHNCLLGA